MRPADTEFAPFYASYIARVPETDPLPALEAQPAELHALADRVTLDDEIYRYALGKWSVRQVVGHLIDTERVMGYRAFAIGRGEAKPLPGFDENEYVARANSDDRSVKELAHEFAAVRHANLWAIRRWAARGLGSHRQRERQGRVSARHRVHHGGPRAPSHGAAAGAVRPRGVAATDVW